MYPAWNFLLYALVLLLTLLLYPGDRRRAVLQPENPIPHQILWGIGLGLGLLLAVGAVNVIFFRSFSVLFFLSRPASVVINFLAFQLLVAVTEELLFRGYFTELGRQMKLPDLAIALLTALFFGLVHWLFNRDMVQFVMSTTIGLVFSLAYLRGKHCSLYSLMIAHFLYDIAIVNV